MTRNSTSLFRDTKKHSMITILVLLIPFVFATKPNQLALSCNKADVALKWLNGAQDEVVVLLQTLFGGYTCEGTLVEACYEQTAKIDAILCIKPEDPTCFDGCHLGDQITLDEECCKNEYEQPYENGEGAICRTNRKWISILFDKLYAAYDEYDKDTDEGYIAAAELACAAETIAGSVLSSIGNYFSDGVRLFRHIVSKQKRVSFTAAPALSTLVRTVQSFRYCPQIRAVCGNHTLIATYTLFRSDVDGAMPVGVNQLLWPIGGTLSNFDKTNLPTDSHCATIHAESPLTPATETTWRLPTLGRLDYARVVQSFSRCSGFPVSGCVQGYHDLALHRCCNTLPLIKDVTRAAHLVKTPVPRIYSFVYVAHINSVVTYESDPTRDVRVDSDLIVRTATADMCSDDVVAVSTPANVVLALSPNTILSMAPGESRCVGGSDDGKICTARNHCGAGLACAMRPGAKKSFCFDGTWWNEAMPCSLNSQCPYGECYGAVSGDSGGVYPYQHIAKENACDDPERATAICNDPKVKNWFDNPRNKVKRL